MSNHTNETPYECIYKCGKSFKKKLYLDVHLCTHHFHINTQKTYDASAEEFKAEIKQE